MFKRLFSLTAFACGSLLLAPDAQAQQALGMYSFTGARGNEQVWPVDQQPTTATFTPMRRGSGVQPAAQANEFAATGWTTATTPDIAQYYAFSVSAVPGTVLNLSMLGLSEMRNFGSIHHLQVRSSLDNFSSSLFEAYLTDSMATSSWTVALDSAFRNVSNVEFRFYGYDATRPAGVWSIDNVFLVGYGGGGPALSPTVQFGTSSQVVSEGGNFAQVPVTISNAAANSPTSVRVRLANAPGTATPGSDYRFTSQTLTFPAGSNSTQVVMIPLVDDSQVEGPETIRLLLDNASAGAVVGANGFYTITIADNDTASGPSNPSIRFAGQGTSVTEGPGNQMVSVPMILNLPQATTTPQAVHVRSWSTSATAGQDYFPLDTVLYFSPMPAGTYNVGTVLVTKDDNVAENPESVVIYFDTTGTTLPVISPSAYTVTIFDNDSTSGGTPTVAFNSATDGVGEGSTQVSVPVTVSGRSFLMPTTVTVRLAANGSGTATPGTDYQFTTQTLSFAPGTPATQYVQLTVVDDNVVEGPETVVLELTNVSTGSTIGQPSMITISIFDNDSTGVPPLDSVGRVTQNDAQGVAIALGRTVRVQGIVTSDNLNTADYFSALQDVSGGIALVRPAGASGANPALGAQVEVIGTIGQVRGLSQLVVNSFRVLSPSHPLPTARLVQTLDETTESELVELSGSFSLVNPAQWTNASTGFSVDITDGTRTFSMYIAPGTNLATSAAPAQAFRVTGLGTQFATSLTAPFLNGYQIMPRSTADLQSVTGLAADVKGTAFHLFPNPATDRLTLEATSAGIATVVDATGRIVLTTALGLGTTEVPVATLRPGLYTVRVGTVAQRFVKQ